MQPIFHLVPAATWRAACDCGRYAPESLASEGFVHFSFADQVAGTANHLYHDRDDLIVVEVDPARLGSEVVVEDLYGMGEAFPHFYGPIPTAAAIAEHPLRRGPRGDFVFDVPA